MSKIFGTLTAVLFLVSAFLFWKNDGAKKKEDVTYESSQKVEKTTTKELAKQVKRYSDADTLREQKLASAAEAEKEFEETTALYEKAKQDVISLKEEHASKEAEIAAADEILKGLPDPKELVPKIKRMRSELVVATDSIAEEESRLINLAELDKNGKSRIKGTRESISMYSNGTSFPTLKTRISSIYRNWGFVILAAGDRQGVVADSILEVVRGGEVIAKLKVTAVEAGRASASIVLDSVAAGTTLQTGDSVIAQREEKKPEATTAAQ